jgi:hypothetical protein
VTCTPHAISVGLGLPDRGKVTFMWCVSEERAREILATLTGLLGDPEHEFISNAEHIDTAARELFNRPGGVLQVDRDG